MLELNKGKNLSRLGDHINKFAVNLKLFRMREGLSQIDLAEQLGISHRTFQRIESNEAEPSLSLLIKLSQIFKVSLSSLIDFIDPCMTARILGNDELENDSDIRDFVNFCKKNFSADLCKLNENCIGDLAKDSRVFKYRLPISISNFSDFYVNQAMADRFQNQLKVNTRYSTGQTYDDINQVISVINMLHGKDKAIFLHHSNHKIGADLYSIKFCGYYRYYNFSHLSLLAILKSEKL